MLSCLYVTTCGNGARFYFAGTKMAGRSVVRATLQYIKRKNIVIHRWPRRALLSSRTNRSMCIQHTNSSLSRRKPTVGKAWAGIDFGDQALHAVHTRFDDATVVWVYFLPQSSPQIPASLHVPTQQEAAALHDPAVAVQPSADSKFATESCAQKRSRVAREEVG